MRAEPGSSSTAFPNSHPTEHRDCNPIACWLSQVRLLAQPRSGLEQRQSPRLLSRSSPPPAESTDLLLDPQLVAQCFCNPPLANSLVIYCCHKSSLATAGTDLQRMCFFLWQYYSWCVSPYNVFSQRVKKKKKKKIRYPLVDYWQILGSLHLQDCMVTNKINAASESTESVTWPCQTGKWRGLRRTRAIICNRHCLFVSWAKAYQTNHWPKKRAANAHPEWLQWGLLSVTAGRSDACSGDTTGTGGEVSVTHARRLRWTLVRHRCPCRTRTKSQPCFCPKNTPLLTHDALAA